MILRRGSEVKTDPLVSVIIPAYNSSDFITDTLESVLRQTLTNYEAIVINDGSPDTEKLRKVLEPYLDRIVYIEKENAGAASARNAGIRHSNAELVAFLDSDDIWFPEYLERQIKSLNENGYDLIYCDAILFGHLRSKKFRTYMQECLSEGEVTTESLLAGKTNLITSGVVARKEAIIRAGMFDETLSSAFPEDFDLWFRLAKQGAKIGYQKKVLLKYRVHERGLTGSDLQKAKRSVKALQMIATKYELTEQEKMILNEQMRKARVELTVQRAKIEMVRENFSRSQKLIKKAYMQSPKLKFAFLILLFKLSPRFILNVFRRVRPAEFASIVSHLHY